MEAWWIAPVSSLVVSGIALLVAGITARRAAASLAADRPALEAVRDDLLGLRHALGRLSDRVEGPTGGAGTGTPDR